LLLDYTTLTVFDKQLTAIFSVGSTQRLEETRRLVDQFQLGDSALKAELKELKEAITEVCKIPV